MNEPFARSSRSHLVITLLAALSLAACSSSKDNGGGGGSSAGTGGGAGGGAGTGGAVAGSSGDAAAGTSGGGGSAGGGMDAGMEAPPMPELNACGVQAKLGAAKVLMQTAMQGGDRATASLTDSVAWFGQLNMDTTPQMLDVQLYKNAAPFGAMLAPMTINLAMGQTDFATCGACVVFHPKYLDGVEIRAQPNYMATSGTLTITAVPNGAATKLTATLSNVTFQHVMIASSTFTTTPVGDNCTVTLTSATIDVNVP
jgi:hypothetical protein